MGAALAGGIGVGLYPDFNISRTMNPIVKSVDPEPEAQAIYQRSYAIFEALYDAVVQVYDMLAEVS